MVKDKQKRTVPRRADAGESRFKLPEREPRERDASFVGELLNAASTQEAASMPSLTTPTSQASTTRHSDAPIRDFAKVPNSLTRISIPAGEFKGKSKQLYDSLYSMTRGSITPRRAVRISRPQLMKKAGIGARVTFDTNVAHLIAIGLLQVRQIAGEHEGNEYTVLLPEERTLPSQSSTTSQTSHAQDQDGLVSLKSSQTRHTLSVDNIDTSGDPKTSSKTSSKNFDDEAAPLRKLERELTGKNSATPAQWNELFELLSTELRIAAARTTVSNVPAFLTEHLRRRLFKRSADEMRVESREAAETPVTPQIDARACTDCRGVGFWYPGGEDKGVARCKHEKLARP